MPVNIPRLRWWFATLAIALLAVVAGFYIYGRYRVRSVVKNLPQKIGVDVQQSTTGFTFSRSQGGRTLFTVHASQAVQYKEGGRATLKDVHIIVYGRQANRYDQIYGTNFEYDPQAGTIAAMGVVHIDLEGNANGPLNPDQAIPAELKNPIHLKTSGLVFNRNTGVAETKNALEFSVPQASGSAVGAVYDSKAATLTLGSNIKIHANAPHEADIRAAHGLIAAGPQRAVLDDVHVEQPKGNFSTDRLTVFLRDDNTIERMLATGAVKAHETGKTSVDASATRAEALLNEKNELQTAQLTGGVALNTTGADNLQASAGKVAFNFGPNNHVDKVRASDGVHLLQQPARAGSGRPVEMSSEAMDFAVRNGKLVTEAVTSGTAQIKIQPAANATGDNASQTVATAGQFRAKFLKNRLASLVGSPAARIVISTPGQADKIATSDEVEAAFAPTGGIGSLVQTGNFHYIEKEANGRREAWAQKATYASTGRGGADMLRLSGSPRFVDGGMTTTADGLEIGRTTGDAIATGDVKTTYSQLKPRPGGVLLASADPIHVTGTSMVARRSTGTAIYQNARLWQGANVVEAPTLEFLREPREVIASGNGGHEVTTVFVEQDKKGKVTPINVRAAKLTYTDNNRQARFEGGVTMKGGDATVTAERLTIYVSATGAPHSGAAGATPGPGKLEKAVALGHVVIQTPTRRATGENLTYLAAEGEFRLTGGSPSIFDAEHGKITGDSLTFFQHDDRVLVESRNSPTITRTRVAK